MKYAILILLVGCIENTTGEPQEGGSDVDSMEFEGAGATTIEPPGLLDGMAGMASDAAGGAMDAMAGLGGDGSGGGGGSLEGSDGGTGGVGGGEGPATPLGGDYGAACAMHGDCVDHPETSTAGYCSQGECVDARLYSWVAEGERCNSGNARCSEPYVCDAGDRCALP